MNGGADLGGIMGLGPIDRSDENEHFHDPWEARVLGLVVALGACGQWNLDQSRFARESLPPASYMQMRYYHIWLEAAQKLMLARGMIHTDELSDGTSRHAPIPVKACLAPDMVQAALEKGGPADRPQTADPQLTVGQQVHTINEHPEGHTRLPRYARDKTGVITHIHGCHVYPDTNARGEGEQPTWLYKVRFDAQTLWGSRANPRDAVTLDLWEPYLRPIS